MRCLSVGTFVALFLAFAPSNAVSATDAIPPEHLAAYVRLIKAERAEQEGEFTEALDHYRAGLDLYLEVARLYPEWKTEMVRYRLAQTKNQIERIEEEQTKRDAANAGGAPLNAVADNEAEVADEAGSGEVPDAALLVELELAREEITILEQTLEELEADRTGLLEQVKTQEARLLAAQQMSEEHARITQALRLAEEKRAMAEETAVQATRALDAVRNEQSVLIDERDLARKELNETQKALEKTEASLQRKANKEETAWHKEREKRAEEIRELKGRIEVLTGELMQREAAVADVQRIENKHRETQEQLLTAQKEWAAATNRANDLAANGEVCRRELAEAQKQLRVLQAELEVTRTNLVARSDEFDAAVMRNGELDRTRRNLEEERARLLGDLKKLEQTLAEDEKENVKTRDLRKALADLKDENKELRREIDGLNKALDRKLKQEDVTSLQQQNLALAEELRVYRAQLAATEKRLRDSERRPSALPGF